MIAGLDEESENTAEASQCGVLLGIPDITLGAEEGGARLRVDEHRDPPLERFVDDATRRNIGDAEPCSCNRTEPWHAPERQFVQWAQKQEAEGEVDESVVMVA